MKRPVLAVILCACSSATGPAPAAPVAPVANEVGGPACDPPPAAADSEARTQLHRLGKAAKVYFIDRGNYPPGEAPATPAEPCRDGAGCQLFFDGWAARSSVWAQLEFAVEDPSLLQYSYQGDEWSFVAIAVWSPGCGERWTWTLRGSSQNGQPGVSEIEATAP